MKGLAELCEKENRYYIRHPTVSIISPPVSSNPSISAAHFFASFGLAIDGLGAVEIIISQLCIFPDCNCFRFSSIWPHAKSGVGEKFPEASQNNSVSQMKHFRRFHVSFSSLHDRPPVIYSYKSRDGNRRIDSFHRIKINISNPSSWQRV